MQAGGFPEPELVHYNPKDFDFGKKKAFPFRDQVTYTVTLHTIPPSPYLDICRALFSIHNLPPNSTMQKEDSHHIKISAHAWSTKCR
jgi:hypothetical protein